MGIRYYGWAVSHDEVIEATDDPWPVIRRADQRHDLPGWTNTSLDKAWWRMQQLLVRRPGYDLVAGDVTYPEGYEQGHLPHVGVLGCEQIPQIARDVASVSSTDVRQHSAGLRYDSESDRESDREYLTYFLGVAQTFTADAAARGHGIVYCIR